MSFRINERINKKKRKKQNKTKQNKETEPYKDVLLSHIGCTDKSPTEPFL